MAKPRHSAGDAGVWESTDRQPSQTASGHAGGFPLASIDFEPPTTRQTLISRALEHEILPRLVLARRPVADVQPATPLAEPADDVFELTRLVLSGDEAGSFAFAETLVSSGRPIGDLFLDVFAPTARHLGDLWIADRADFSSVTLGSWILQQIVRRLRPEFEADAPHRVARPTILLSAVFGEQHTFGLDMVAAFFRRGGWDVSCVPTRSRQDLVECVRAEPFDVVGLSLANEMRLEDLCACVRAVRLRSRNRAVGIMVGGPVFNDHPEYVAQTGADLTACDGRQATLQAERFVSLSRIS